MDFVNEFAMRQDAENKIRTITEIAFTQVLHLLVLWLLSPGLGDHVLHRLGLLHRPLVRLHGEAAQLKELASAVVRTDAAVYPCLRKCFKRK